MPQTLTVLVFPTPQGELMGQALEKDIVVTGDNLSEVFDHLGYVCTVEMQLAEEDGRVPFGDLPPAPKEFQEYNRQERMLVEPPESSRLRKHPDCRVEAYV